MEQNNLIIITYNEENDIDILKESLDKFKRVYHVDFETKINSSQKILVIDMEDISPNNTFLAGYYYGALQYINKKRQNN